MGSAGPVLIHPQSQTLIRPLRPSSGLRATLTLAECAWPDAPSGKPAPASRTKPRRPRKPPSTEAPSHRQTQSEPGGRGHWCSCARGTAPPLGLAQRGAAVERWESNDALLAEAACVWRAASHDPMLEQELRRVSSVRCVFAGVISLRFHGAWSISVSTPAEPQCKQSRCWRK